MYLAILIYIVNKTMADNIYMRLTKQLPVHSEQFANNFAEATTYKRSDFGLINSSIYVNRSAE